MQPAKFGGRGRARYRFCATANTDVPNGRKPKARSQVRSMAIAALNPASIGAGYNWTSLPLFGAGKSFRRTTTSGNGSVFQ